jgi:hypothetical protein
VAKGVKATGREGALALRSSSGVSAEVLRAYPSLDAAWPDILADVAEGVPVVAACSARGFSRQAVYDACARKPEMRADLERANSACEATLAKTLFDAAKIDWRAALAIVKHRFGWRDNE